MNRQQGPDRVLDLAAERLEISSGSLAELLPMAEHEALALTYKKTAGSEPALLNNRDSNSVF